MLPRALLPVLFIFALLPRAGAQNPAPPEVVPEVPPQKPALNLGSPASVPASKLSPLTERPNWKRLAEFSGVISREEFDSAFATIYSDGTKGAPPWTFAPGKILVETSPGESAVEIAFRDPVAPDKTAPRYWHAVRELPPLKVGEPPLKGMHIALDPGHIGGSFARMEERWLSMSPGTEIMEAALVLQVAEIIKPRLEALGARISLVRERNAPVTTAKVEDFAKVAREILLAAGISAPKEKYTPEDGEAKVATVQWQEEKLFYRVSEIHARAKKVNDVLRPDLVVCLHLNAEPWGDPAHPSPVPQNHFHLLVNGCYSHEELQLEDVRHGMLLRLFSRIHEEEHRLASVFASAMAAATGLPPYVYPKNNARRTGDNPYVFARNLLAGRLYECPVMYLEPYVMNNEQTYKRLLLGHFIGRTLLDDRLVTSPLEDYATGVVRALEDYGRKERRIAP